MKIRVLTFLAFFLLSFQTLAATLMTNSSGVLTGFNNVEIKGGLFSVRFVDGSCGGCDIWNSGLFGQLDYRDAAQALRDLIDANPFYDQNPAMTYGCTSTSLCRMFTVGTGFEMMMGYMLSGIMTSNGASEAQDLSTEYFTGNFNAANLDDTVYAVWAKTSEVPLPMSGYLFFTSLAGLMGLKRRAAARALPLIR